METTAPPAPITADVDGEQRRATLMFADVSGSTELIESLDPEAAANLLDPLIGVMSETVERYGGVIHPRGDGILAVFGIGGTAEDSTARACFAALEILQRLEGATGRVRIGIHQGEVALLSGPRRQSRENLFGPAIHMAARLEQTAEPGTASISADAYALVREFVEAEPLPSVEMKGVSRPLQRLRLLRTRTTSRWRARLAQGLSPLVGRQAELAALTRFVQDGGGAGVSLLQVLGPAGIGKSRLVHELLRSKPARASYVIALAGPVHRGYPGYDPIAAWLLDLAGDSIERLSEATTLTVGERERLSRYLDLGKAANIRVVDLDTVTPLRVIGPIATIITSLARGRRIILSCEDAEALSSDRLEQIATLASAVAQHGLGVTLVISSRRALKLRTSSFTARRTLRLAALAPADARQLLDRLHPDLRRRSALIEPILAKADGNPLFLEEVAALFLAGAQRSGDEDIALAIPDKIEALIADRLASIPRQVQTLLLGCSVLGNTFSPSLLVAVTEQCAKLVEEHLRKLKAEHLLFEMPAAPTPRLGFSHPLTRDVSYLMLLPSKRRSLHEKVFRLLQSQPSLASLEDLCHHAVNARLWPEALHYLQQAAVAATERAAYASAEQHLRRALKIAEQQPQDRPMRRTMVEIMVGLRALAILDLRHGEAEELLDRAEQLGADLEPTLRLAIQVKRIRGLNIAGRLREAIAVADETLRQARDAGNIPAQLTAAHNLGQSYLYVGRFAAGDAALTEAVALPRAPFHESEFSVFDQYVLIPATRAGIRGFLGRFTEARIDAAQAIATAQTHNAPYDLSFAQFVAGIVQLQQRHLNEAEAAFRVGLERAERHGLRALLPALRFGLGYTLLLGNSTNAAIATLADAHEVAEQSNRVFYRAWAAVGLAAAYGSTGGMATALRYADEAVRLGARHTMRGLLVGALRCRGALLATQEETRADGVRVVRQALALARKLGMRPDIAHCQATLAAILGHGDARMEAREVYHSLGMQQWAEHVLGGSVPLSIIAA